MDEREAPMRQEIVRWRSIAYKLGVLLVAMCIACVALGLSR